MNNYRVMNQLTAKPFVKWAGGKGKLLPTLARLLPDGLARRDGLTYIEPFVGGGAMLFFMLQKFGNIRKAVINDINPDLITAYRMVKNNPEKLVGRLSAIQKEYFGITGDDGRKEFYLAMRKQFNDGGMSVVDNAACLIFLNRTCFNGLYRVNSKGGFNVPFGRYKTPKICDEETIYADSRLLQDVEITCGDFEQVLEYISADAFVYLDPPYRPLDATSSFTSYSKDGFDDNEQIRLKKFLDKLTSAGCPAMLSNSDVTGHDPQDTFLDDLYDGYRINRVYAPRSINAKPDGRGQITELLVRNYTDNGVVSTGIIKHGMTTLNINNYEQSPYKRTV